MKSDAQDGNRALLARHRAFWGCEEVESPLLGIVVGGWSRFLDNPAADGLWGEGRLYPDMLEPAKFVADWDELLGQYEELGDDVFHTAQPFPGVPWLEAIAGCPIRRSERHLWAAPVPDALERLDEIAFDASNSWVVKYMEFLDVFGEKLSPQHAVGQSVVRGPGDVASALLGEERMVFAFHDAPEQMRKLLERLTTLCADFIRAQAAHVPAFHGGSVVGQFEVWAPGWAVRLQDDALGLLSPRLYAEFMGPLHEQLCALSPYNMFHLHTTSLHVLSELLQTAGLGAVEISRDEGVTGLADMLPAFKQVQEAGRPLLVKGRLSQAELLELQRDLSPRGLCLQTVVDTWDEARDLRGLMTDA